MAAVVRDFMDPDPVTVRPETAVEEVASDAADKMTSDRDTVSPGATVQDAARIIHESGHNRLPVVEDRRLVGVVTRLDLLGALAA